MNQIRQIEGLSKEQEVFYTHALYNAVLALQVGARIVDGLPADPMAEIVMKYLRSIKQADILDDPPLDDFSNWIVPTTLASEP